MRSLTLEGVQSLFAQDTASVWLPALTFAPPEGEAGDVLRVVSNMVDIEYEGNTYVACPFELSLANDSEEAAPQVQVRVDNVSQDLTRAVREASGSPIVVLEVFRVNPAGTVTREMGPAEFSLLSVTVDTLLVEGSLGYQTDVLNEPAVVHRFTPNVAPGLFP
jgi:hypothetical protein